MIYSASSIFPRGIECPPLVVTLTESLSGSGAVKGGAGQIQPFLQTICRLSICLARVAVPLEGQQEATRLHLREAGIAEAYMLSSAMATCNSFPTQSKVTRRRPLGTWQRLAWIDDGQQIGDW